MVKGKIIRVGNDYIRLTKFIRENSGLPPRILSDPQISNILSNFVFEEKLDPYLINRIKKGKNRGFF